MFSFVPLIPFVSIRVQGFWFPLLTFSFSCLSLHPSLFLLPHNYSHYSSHQTFLFIMSPSTTPVIPSASVFSQTVLENGYDHLRDHASDGGYMGYGVRFSGLELTYNQVRGWDRNGLCFNSRSVFLAQPSPLLRSSFGREGF